MSKVVFTIALILSFVSLHGQNTNDKEEVDFDRNEMLELVNEARLEDRKCGDRQHEAVKPLKWNRKLKIAALKHANDMDDNDFFDHTGSDGSTIVVRVEREKYEWRTVGENVAKGPRSVAEAVQGWLESPGHCSNLMNPEFEEMGAAVSDEGNYWVQVFAAPREQ